MPCFSQVNQPLTVVWGCTCEVSVLMTLCQVWCPPDCRAPTTCHGNYNISRNKRPHLLFTYRFLASQFTLQLCNRSVLSYLYLSLWCHSICSLPVVLLLQLFPGLFTIFYFLFPCYHPGYSCGSGCVNFSWPRGSFMAICFFLFPADVWMSLAI